eukprot:9602630-Heterocapsa_arctica.AAC.1
MSGNAACLQLFFTYYTDLIIRSAAVSSMLTEELRLSKSALALMLMCYLLKDAAAGNIEESLSELQAPWLLEWGRA